MAKSSRDKLKIKAFDLRKQNRSYNEISQLLGVSKSTLSNWLKKESFSIEIKKTLTKSCQKKAIKQLKLMAAANKEKWGKMHESYRNKAREEFVSLFSNTFFEAGLVIYWGEGDKKIENSIVRVSNTDYRMLRIFVIFLIKICQIPKEKIRAWLLLYPDLDDTKCKTYWSTRLKIPLKQFIKSQYIRGRERSRRVNYGVCTVQVYSRELKEKILEWIDLYSEKLITAGIV